MSIRFSADFIKKLEKLKKTNTVLVHQINTKLSLFSRNPQHPSLRVHKLSGKLDNLWSISINKKFRLIYLLGNNETHFVDLGTHDEVYKK